MAEAIVIFRDGDAFTATSEGGMKVVADSVAKLLETPFGDSLLSALIPDTALILNLNISERAEFLTGLRPGDPVKLAELEEEEYPELWECAEGRSLSTGNLIDGKPWGWIPSTIGWDPDEPYSYEEWTLVPQSLSKDSTESSLELYTPESRTSGFYTSRTRFSEGVAVSSVSDDNLGILKIEVLYGVDIGTSFTTMTDAIFGEFGGEFQVCPVEDCDESEWVVTLNAQENVPANLIADVANRLWVPCEEHQKIA